jgi:hypothetical protein
MYTHTYIWIYIYIYTYLSLYVYICYIFVYVSFLCGQQQDSPLVQCKCLHFLYLSIFNDYASTLCMSLCGQQDSPLRYESIWTWITSFTIRMVDHPSLSPLIQSCFVSHLIWLCIPVFLCCGQQDSPLVRGARQGSLVILDGLHALHPDTLATLQRLIHDRYVIVIWWDNSLSRDSFMVVYKNRSWSWMGYTHCTRIHWQLYRGWFTTGMLSLYGI